MINIETDSDELAMIAFDPGYERGGVAYWHKGHLHALTTGDVLEELGTFTELIRSVNPTAVIVEQIPMLSSPNSIKLGMSYGAITEAVHAADVRTTMFVRPATWQRHHNYPTSTTYAQRKKFAHRLVVENYPGIAINESVCDAILLLDYLKDNTAP